MFTEKIDRHLAIRLSWIAPQQPVSEKRRCAVTTLSSNQDLGDLVLGNLIWQKCQEDPELGNAPETMKEVLGEYINLSPTILKEQLFEPVSLNSILQAKLSFLQYCQENDFVQKAVAALPEESLGWMSRSDMSDSMTSTFGSLIEFAKDIIGDISGFLRENGISEEQVLTAPGSNLCLNEGLQERYRTGTLTIRDVLLEQPTIILNNS